VDNVPCFIEDLSTSPGFRSFFVGTGRFFSKERARTGLGRCITLAARPVPFYDVRDSRPPSTFVHLIFRLEKGALLSGCHCSIDWRRASAITFDSG
jgi:hypothetical protein